jgi:predicted 3-demethylubiquinone-9 3-methyltransferase (glyoxalase superfamily)
MQKIVTFLAFDNQAEEAVSFYASIFKDSKSTGMMREPGGAPLGVSFQLAGQDFIALNGGPSFSFSQAISLFVNCETQAEVDELWEELSEGGEKLPCGWLKDKFGVSWQVVPKILPKLLSDPDAAKRKTVFEAMTKMKKLDIAALQQAYDKG